MAKLMAPNIRIDWYPEGHFWDITRPTLEELNSGVNISCAIVTGYTLDFTDPNTETFAGVLNDFTSEIVNRDSYEAELQFFLAPRGSNADNEAAYRKAEEIFYIQEKRKGYLSKRFGFPWDMPYDIEEPRQRVDLFKVQADLPKVTSEDGEPILLNVRYIPQGEAVSGTKSGRIIYDWEGDPNNSPSVEMIETALYTYEWEGEPHGSESIKYRNGVEVARNKFTNPSFESGLDGLSTSPSSEIRQVGGLAVGVGSNGLQVELVNNSTTGGWISQTIDVSSEDWGKWVGWSALVRVSSGVSRLRWYYQVRQGSTVLSDSYVDSFNLSGALMPDVPRMSFATQIDSGADNIRLWLRPMDAIEYARYYSDGWFSTIADTEEQALNQAVEYFDGDSKPTKGTVLRRNLFPNPKPTELGNWSASSGVQDIDISNRTSSRFPWLPDHINTVIRFRPSSDATSSQYVLHRVDDITGGRWYALKVSVYTGSWLYGMRVYLQWRDADGTTIQNDFVQDDMPPSAGKEYHVTAQAPSNAHYVNVIVWPPDNPPLYRYYEFAGVILGEGETEEEAIEQVEYYFDGDMEEK